MIDQLINFLNNFISQNCIGGPMPPPPTPPNPNTPVPPAGMVQCSNCMGGNPITNFFPMQPPGGGPSCPPGWTSNNANPCSGATGGTPPPPGYGTGGGTPPPPGYGTGGGVVNNGFTSY